MSSRIVFLLLATWMAVAAGAQAAPVATIVEGDSVLVRGATRLALVEGMRLAPDDLIEATAQAKLLRIEFDDGLMVLIAPGTRLWLEPRFRVERGEGAARAARLYLLSGTIKLTAKAGATSVATPVATPFVDVVSAGQDAVISLAAGKVEVFAESGEVRLTERNRGKSGATLAGGTIQLRNGEFFSRSGADKSVTSPRTDADFIPRLPRAFLDSLPSRASVYAGRNVVPKPAGEFGYADAQPWVDSEAALRPSFVARWKPLAAQPAFRQALAADMSAHPEWDRVLYPEKYLPKPKPKAAVGAASAASLPH